MSTLKVKDIYTKLNIPSIDLQRFTVSIQRHLSKMREPKKYPMLKRTSAVFNDKYISF